MRLMVYSPAGKLVSLTVKPNGISATIVSVTCARAAVPPVMVKIDIIATNNNMFFIASLHSVSDARPGVGLRSTLFKWTRPNDRLLRHLMKALRARRGFERRRVPPY